MQDRGNELVGVGEIRVLNDLHDVRVWLVLLATIVKCRSDLGRSRFNPDLLAIINPKIIKSCLQEEKKKLHFMHT